MLPSTFDSRVSRTVPLRRWGHFAIAGTKQRPTPHDGPMHDVLQGHCDPGSTRWPRRSPTRSSAAAKSAPPLRSTSTANSSSTSGAATRTRAKTMPWGEDTIVNVFSSTKNDHRAGRLDAHRPRAWSRPIAPVARYWPEFAANGKQDIEFRHLLSHSSGRVGMGASRSPVEDIYDWDKSTATLGRAGAVVGAGHGVRLPRPHHGHLIGEVLRRVTGKTLKDFVRDEIAGPLGADFQIGASHGGHRPHRGDHSRRRNRWTCPCRPAGPSRCSRRSSARSRPPAIANTAAWRAADIGAANGHGNARSLARILSAISLGGTVERRSAAAAGDHREDLRGAVRRTRPGAADHPLRWGLGFGLPQPRIHSVRTRRRRSASGAAGADRGRR